MRFLPLLAAAAFLLPASAPAVTYFWNSGAGSGDGTSIYQEANWDTVGDGSGTQIPVIDPDTAIAPPADLIVNAGIPGGAGGGSDDLRLNGGSLTVNDGTFRMSTVNEAGIHGGSVTQSGGTIISQFFVNVLATLSDGTLEVHGAGNPLNSSTIDFPTGSTGDLHLVNEGRSATRTEHLAKFTVNGQPAVENSNIYLLSDGAAGTIVTIQAPPASADSDDDLLTNGQELTTYLTDPFDPDSDGDGTPDGLEIANGLDPNDPAEKLDRPNIIFVLVDDLGWGDLGVFFQNARTDPLKHATPHLDTMATEGLQLRAHYCPAPVCVPSRCSLLSGVHQGHATLRNSQFDDALQDNHSLASTMKSAGYATACVGKWGVQGRSGSNPSGWVAYPTKRGFDFSFSYVRHTDGHQHYPGDSYPAGNSTAHRAPKEVWENNSEISGSLSKCFTPDLFTARAKAWIGNHLTASPNQPFFLYLAHDTPHAALQIPTQAYPTPLGAAGGIQWNGTGGGAAITTATGTIDSYRHPDYLGKGWTNGQERFATLVRRIDTCMGDLIQTLKDLGIDNNTLVVFTSDNGPHTESYLTGVTWQANHFDSYGPFDGVKRDCWEGGIRMPTLARWPGGIATPGIVDTPSQFHDWMPTFCELAGVAPPSRSDGTSLVPTLTGAGTQEESLIYIEYSTGSSTPSYSEFDPAHRGRTRGQMQVLHLDGYKGVRYSIGGHGDNFEIYDLAADPQETTDLSANPPSGQEGYFASLQQRMKDRVLQVRQPEVADPDDPMTRVDSRPYDSELVPPIAATTLPGLEIRSFEGLWPWLPEFATMTPLATVTETNVTLTHLSRSDDAGLLFTGLLAVPADGTWTFYTDSDAGTHLRIHESQVIDDDYRHDGSEASGTILLKAGLHPFRLYYRSRLDTPSLTFSWAGPGVPKDAVPAAAFVLPSGDPVAADDSATTTGGQVDIAVLANDGDDGLPSPLSISAIGTPGAGTATDLGGVIRYTPDPGFLGTDTFDYTITDGANFATGTVTVAVVYQDSDFWIPLNECGGSLVHEAGGTPLGSMAGFADISAARIAGVHGRAMTFDGSNDQVSLTGLPAANLPSGAAPRTIMCWVRVPPGQANENQTMFGYGANANGQRFTFRLNGSSGSPVGQELRLEVQGGNIVGTTLLDDGNWHHVAAVCDDFDSTGGMNVDETRLYVDGNLEAISSSTTEVMNTAAGTTALLGGSNHNNGYNFLGDIDELRLFPSALTQAEIQAHLNAADQASEAWHRRHFGAAAIDWNADDDGDRASRLLELGLGGQPGIAEFGLRQPRAVYNATTGKLALTFTRRTTGSHGLLYTVQVSNDLEDWDTLTASESGSLPLSLVDCLEEVTFATDASSLTEGRQFARVMVEFAP